MKNSTLKLKKGDQILVTVGKDRGKQGKIDRIITGKGALIQGVNLYKKHRKPQGENRPGEIVTLNRPVVWGNMALVCPKCKQASRVGFRLENGKKLRVCRKCNSLID